MALRVTLFAALALLVPAPAGAAVLESSGDLDAVVAAFESSMPGSGSGGYDQPSQAETSAFATGFDRARAGDYLGAAAVLDPLAFDVVLFTDSTTGRRLTVLAERSQSGAWPHGWGLYVHDPAARTPGLVVQAPHPIFDQRTPALAVRTFDWAGAGTLMVAGTHRNANAAVDARGYRVSDMSHAYDSVFQAVHSRASGPGVRVLQIHGFAQDSLAACRDLVVSGGIAPAPPFASSLASGMVSRNYNVFLYEGQDCGEGLSGTQNAQGPAARQAGADFTHLEIRNYLRTGDALREQLAFDLADVIAGAAAPPPGGGPGGGGSGGGGGGSGAGSGAARSLPATPGECRPARSPGRCSALPTHPTGLPRRSASSARPAGEGRAAPTPRVTFASGAGSATPVESRRSSWRCGAAVGRARSSPPGSAAADGPGRAGCACRPDAGGSVRVRPTTPATPGLPSPGWSCRASVRRVPAPTREEAWQLVTEWIQDEGLRRHLLGVEAAMRAYAQRAGADEELWGVTGLLHDLDYERHPDLGTGHPRIALGLFEEREYPQELIDAVAGHAEFMGVPRETEMAKTLYAVDELSGFIAACALVRPTGIHGLAPKSVKKKLKQPSFAAGVNRDEVRAGAEELGVDFDEHVAFVIAAMAERAEELGLEGRD